MRVISEEKIPIKLWASQIEDGALVQARNLANFPFAVKHIAVMPDVHQGYGMPIGGVMATKDVVIPNAVGVDIGCGMCAVRTSLTEIDTDTLKKILGEIRQVIPVGFKKHETAQHIKNMPDGVTADMVIVTREYQNTTRSLGTLGGGNHFIEIQEGSDGYIWIMIHSGSRNLGFKVANHYNKLAVKLNERWKSSVPKSWELAFLPIKSEEGQAYLNEMQYCVDFALANRKLMMQRAVKIFMRETNPTKNIRLSEMINIAHNYAALENHFGMNLWVHRKGATKATKGLTGIIPGSQGTSSYIVEGLGNRESFMSCSHGAGRTMSRTQARKELNLEEEISKLEDKGILHSIRGQRDLDEASGAYKDIDRVMEEQRDLAKIKVTLDPLAVIKG